MELIEEGPFRALVLASSTVFTPSLLFGTRGLPFNVALKGSKTEVCPRKGLKLEGPCPHQVTWSADLRDFLVLTSCTM